MEYAEFSPDGRRIVTTSRDGMVRVWRMTWEGLFEYLRTSVKVCLEPEERIAYLGESPSESWERYADCQKRHGRTPRTTQAPR